MNLLPAKCDRTTNRWSAREIGEVFNEPMFVPFLLLLLSRNFHLFTVFVSKCKELEERNRKEHYE